MTGILIGMALMAAGAIWLRSRGADQRLASALNLLVVFALGLALVLGLEDSPWEDWQVVVLPLLPPLLAQHLRRLSGTSRWPRAELALAASGALCLPFLLLPSSARASMMAGEMPEVAPILILVSLAGIALYWLFLCLVTALAGLGILRELRRQRAALAQVLAQPSPRFDAVAALGLGVAALFGLQLLDLLTLGRVLVGPLADLFVFALILSTAAHGLTLRLTLPDWATDVVAEAPSYARSGLDPEAMALLLTRIDAAMRRDGLWREPDLSLADLATAAHAKPFYVSQALNQGKGENFYDYVNRWRVAEAKELLQTTGDTVLSIAYATGFNAKSTFNAAFLKLVGMTPSAWRASGPKGSDEG